MMEGPDRTNRPVIRPITLRAITLHQPWASLVAAGAKRIETRNWPAPRSLIGRHIAIHAARKVVKLSPRLYPEYNAALERWLGAGWESRIPTGAVVAVARLQYTQVIHENLELPAGDEFLFGDYEPGRWMWLLHDIQALLEPARARGRQAFWNWEIPPETVLLPAIA